ncbi:histidine ammonia-lyase [Natronolimnobius sp. AArcel1]|uniref:histidine ammonia-lyase n=1 Tax=Natronolimnobius sp. AArcel1 TaxID=1679093 RepID=UPI0013EAB73B|nr:histidine ammonia-lyase [Natronolimnobius sp. AArcel1]NGM71009.1 histidine ammonia-lyase [Natronolimnobius sp. AArcel1]
MTVVLDGETLTPADVAAVARDDERVEIADAARDRVHTSRERVEDVIQSGEAVYGINTGFGELVDERIPPEKREQLQVNLLRSHAAGAGRELTREEVRAMLVARINALVKGYSGVRERVVNHLVTLCNEGVQPVVYSRGSLGASGDLAPLAHLSLVLIGEGEADIDATESTDSPRRVSGQSALEEIGLEALSLEPKEGLALINGTQLTTGLAALAVVDGERLVTAADAAGALTTETTLGTTATSESAIHDVRPHAGQQASAANVRAFTAGSDVVEAHRNCDRVQDAYSLRCFPQVHGAVRDAIAHLRDAVEVELNSATDNPLVFAADRVDDRASGTDRAAVLSGGNFHGTPLALRLEYVRLALADLAAITERRIDRLLNPNLQESHLPPFLATDSGVESGYMIAQYTAAALCTEIRSLGPASTDNTPVSGGQEDHVSMSAHSALYVRRALESARWVVAAELVCGTEAADYLDEAFDTDESLSLGTGTAAARDLVREVVPPLAATGDRPVRPDIEAVAALLEDGLVTGALEQDTA